MKNYLIGAVAVLALILGGFALLRGPSTIENTTVGATPGADSNFQCETHNGAQTCFARLAMSQATTTVCAIKSPAATSTIRFAGAHFTVGSTSAAIVTIAKSATAYATTTSLARLNMAANAQLDIFASSTQSGTGASTQTANMQVPPNNFIVVGLEGGGGAAGVPNTYSPTGFCSFQFDTL